MLQTKKLGRGVTNALMLETNASKTRVETSATTHATHVPNSDFEEELISKLLLICTHLRKRCAVLVLTCEYAHPQVAYAIAFSAGLNCFQVHYVGKENDKRTSPYTSCSLTLLHAFSFLGVAWVYVPRPHNYCVKGQQEAQPWDRSQVHILEKKWKEQERVQASVYNL